LRREERGVTEIVGDSLKLFRAALGALFIFLVAVVLAEAIYRWHLSRDVHAEIARRMPSEATPNFVAYGVAPWRFDRDMGFSFVPRPWRAAQINDGRFTGCSVTGRGDQFGNYDLDADRYADADIRLAIFGSSFSMTGYSEGRMVSQALSEKLSVASGKRVHTLNFSRDATGVLSYFDAARVAVRQFRLDAAIFLINASGVAYQRHWRTVVPADDGYRRLYMLSEPIEKVAENPSVTPHPAVINDNITEEWCRTATADDPLVRSLIQRHIAQLREQTKPRVAIKFWRLDRSFAINLVRHGDPYHRMRLFEGQQQYSPYARDRYSDDPGFRDAVAQLKLLRVPIVLVHIPTLPEMRRADGGFDFAAQGIPPKQGNSLVADLQATTGERMIDLYELYPATAKQDPIALVASEQNWHPSSLGTEHMAEALARVILDRADTRLLLSRRPSADQSR